MPFMHYFPCCLAKHPESVMSGTWNDVATAERQDNSCLYIVYNPQPEQTTVIDKDSASARLYFGVHFWIKSILRVLVFKQILNFLCVV